MSKTCESGRHAVEMYASAVIAFTHLYTSLGSLFLQCFDWLGHLTR